MKKIDDNEKQARRFVIPRENLMEFWRLYDDWETSGGRELPKFKLLLMIEGIYPEVSEEGTHWQLDITDAFRPAIEEVFL